MEEIDFSSDTFEDIVGKDPRYNGRAYALLMDCVRYLGYTVEEFEKLDVPDYLMLMDAVGYRESDRAFWVHFLAWQTMRAKGRKKSGKGYKPAYPHFRQFYDAEKAEKQLRKKKEPKKSRLGGLSEFLKRKKEGEANG